MLSRLLVGPVFVVMEFLFPDTLSQRSFSFVKSKFWDSQLLEDEGKLQSAGFQHGGFSSSSRSFSAATK